MALKDNTVDIYRGTEGIVLPKDISNDIWENVVEESAIMRVAERVDLPGRGVTIPVITGDPIADIVSETAEKPVSNATFATKDMTPIKFAVIELFSNEFKRDLPALYDGLVRRLPAAISKRYDQEAFHAASPKDGFDSLADAPALAIEDNTYDALVGAKAAVAAADGMVNGFVLAPQAEVALLTAKDGDGRPIFINNASEQGSVNRILGEPAIFARSAYKEGTPEVLGFAGDWSYAKYGIAQDITMRISEEATINTGSEQINLWQRNMFAVLVEAELGFIVRDKNAFVRLTAASA